jgi:hypothetical protein
MMLSLNEKKEGTTVILSHCVGWISPKILMNAQNSMLILQQVSV